LAAEEEGGTVLDHLKAVERSSGVTPTFLLNGPALPKGCEQLWRTFSELHACRGSNGFGPTRITYTDIDAYQRVTGRRLRQWELEAIRAADAAYLEKYAERNQAE
jgi:hypothetical protein